MQDHSLLWLDFRGIFLKRDCHIGYIIQSTASCGSIHTAHVYSGVDVEKEESTLKKEVKICMPYYKIAYQSLLLLILSATSLLYMRMKSGRQ